MTKTESENKYKCCRCGQEKDDRVSRYTFDEDSETMCKTKKTDLASLKKVCWECKGKERKLITQIREAAERFETLMSIYILTEDSQLTNSGKNLKKSLLDFCTEELHYEINPR